MAMVHYKGEIGEFDYDDEMFEMQSDRLRLKSGYKGPIDLPVGIKICSSMFSFVDLAGCYFRDFNTSQVIDMRKMFTCCKFPEGFSLGEDFDTSKVKVMSNMFQGVKFPKGFTLGGLFNTSQVEDMSWMFYASEISEGFSLGNNFDTSNVLFMNSMFNHCKMPTGFSLGNKFKTSHGISMDHIFIGCKLGDKDLLGDPLTIIESLKPVEMGATAADVYKVLEHISLSAVKNCDTNEDLINLIKSHV